MDSSKRWRGVLLAFIAVGTSVGVVVGVRALLRGEADCALPQSKRVALRQAAVDVSAGLSDEGLGGDQVAAFANDERLLRYGRACAEASGVFDDGQSSVRYQLTMFSSWGRFDSYLYDLSFVAGRVSKQQENTPENVGPFVVVERLGEAARSDLYCTGGSLERCTEWIVIRRSEGCHSFVIEVALASAAGLSQEDAAGQLMLFADRIESETEARLRPLECSVAGLASSARWSRAS